jgi:hypothetical protein
MSVDTMEDMFTHLILDSGYWILDSGYLILDSGCWMLVH